MILILFGPPGAGKGTQAQRLAFMRDLRHVSTGDLLRAARTAGTALGREANEYMAAGRLVPDAVVNGLVAEVLRDEAYGGVLLDGYPRTLDQAEWLTGELRSHGTAVDAVLSLQVSEQDIVSRLSGRRTDSATGLIYHVDYNPPPSDIPEQRLIFREDDRPEAIRKRLDVYREETAPLERYFRDNARLIEIDGSGDVDEVGQRIAAAVDGLLRSARD